MSNLIKCREVYGKMYKVGGERMSKKILVVDDEEDIVLMLKD